MNTPQSDSLVRHVVLVADKLSDAGVALLRERPEFEVRVAHGLSEAELVRAIADVDALLVRSSVKVTRSVVEAGKRLRLIGRAGIGIDNVDVTAATERGVLVMNCPEANADTTAEHVLGLIIALARHIPLADRAIRSGRFERGGFMGTELRGKVLGLLGGGNVGARVAKLAHGLGMESIVYDPALAPDALREAGATVLPLEVVLTMADFLSVHVPYSEATHHFVDAKMLSRLKRGVRIIQCSRGGVVDENSLLDALRSGQVGGAALDVFETEPLPKDHPLLSFEDVIVTPCLGSSTHEAQARAATEICRQTIAYLLDGELRNAVNLPRMSTTSFRAAAPWIDLGRKLGRLLSGISPAGIRRIEVAYHGRLATLDTGAITRSVVAGFASGRLRDRVVNEVNAPAAANELGFTFHERRSEHMRDFPSLLSVTADALGDRIRVAGTLFGHRQPRIVKILEHPLEALAEGSLLIVRNEDRPGVVGRLGTLLGEAGVNIRAMHLSPPRSEGGDALAVLNVEPALSTAALESIRALPLVRAADVVDLSAS